MEQQCARKLSAILSPHDQTAKNELLQSFMYNTSDGIVIMDLEGRVLAVNHAFEFMYGWSSEEVVGKILPTTPPYQMVDSMVLHHKTLAGMKVNDYKTCNLRKDGNLIHVSVTISPIKNSQGNIIALIGVERDITAHKNAEKRLFERGDDSRQLLENSLEPIIVYTEYKIVYANPAAIDFIGAKHRENVIGKYIFEILPHHFIDDLVYNENASKIIQNKFVRMDERIIDVEVKAIPIHYSGKPSVQLLCRDISDRKKVENSLYEAESLYKNVVENALIGVYICQAGKTIYANLSLAKMFGYSMEEFMEIQPSELTFEEDWAELFEDARNTLIEPESKFRFHIRGKKKDQSVIYLEGSAIPIINKGEPAVFVAILDVTYKKESEDLLIESAQRYQALVKFLPEPIVVSVDGLILYANLSAMKMVKASRDQDVIGKSTFDFVHPEYHEASRAIMRDVLQTDEPFSFQDRKIICTDGEVIEVEISSIRIHNYMGKMATLSVIRDLSERKRTEESLIQSEKLSVVGQLAAGVAHEIRNPLTSLSGFCKLLKSRFGDQVSYIDVMLNELDRINMIVNEFMTLAKPHITQFTNGSVNEILKSVMSILETQAILLNVNMETLLDESIPYVYCEENQLKQVFINVIKNAIEAMPQGGNVTITTAKSNDGYVCVRIIDQGKGIPNEIIDKIGGPFFTTKESGTGLGLMICHQIIESHQGFLHISSKIGEGTTVEILLPVFSTNL
ncbi:PAS domain S-box protein [Cohnella sp.]|uniref:PAS domain S-box protein n=1 Tax=Cohnella sp. TaxID=1883426 RepID=UPI003563D32E